MNKSRTIIPFLLCLFFIAALVVINLKLPTDAQAGPMAGFTPNPGDGGGDKGDDDDDGGGEERGRKISDIVRVRLERCDLVCLDESSQAGQSAYEPLAYAIEDAPSVPVLVPISEAVVDYEIVVPVQLIHEGSGFISNADLSTHRDTNVGVPYPGRWEVFLTDSPRFMTTKAMDMSKTNMAEIDVDLSNGPISIGMVEANTVETQYVDCPIECLIEPEPTPTPTPTPQVVAQVEEQPLLPTTGLNISTSNVGVSAIIVVLLTGTVVLGVMLFNGLVTAINQEEDQ